MQDLAACASVFGMGFAYFIGAFPAGALLKLSPWLIALAAWLGYSAGGMVVAYGGAPLRMWLMKRFKIDLNAANPSLVLRAWNRYGLPALGILAPVTIGPQIGALLGLALGAPKGRLVLAISLGALPWAVSFAILVALGVKLAK